MKGGAVRRFPRFALVAVVGAAVSLGGSATRTSAGQASGCTWSVVSWNADHTRQLDTASGPGDGATSDNPLDVDAKGSIQYSGTTDAVIANGEWTVETSGVLNIPFHGRIENSSGSTSYSDEEPLEEHLTKDLPLLGTSVLLQGLIHVDFTATGESGATCTASGYLKVGGAGFFESPQTIMAVMILMLGIVLGLLAWPTGPVGPSVANEFGGAALEVMPDELALKE
jgi:hypothetical protein